MKKNINIIVLCLIILSSIILEATKLSLVFGSSYTYIIKPLIWLFIGVVTFVFFKNGIIANNKYKSEVNFIVLVATMIYFLIYFILGYINGFAHNPYDTTLRGIIINLWSFLPMLIIREYVRYYMINNCDQKKILWWAFFISIIFCLTELNVYKFDVYFASSASALEFIIETLVPSLIINLFLSYISYFAGWKTTIMYALLPQLCLYVLPILPNVDWATLSILNSSIPFFTYIYANYRINKMDKTLNRKQVNTVDLKGWLVMIVIVALMLCFGLGMFPVEPIVIASNSMAPKIYKGDVVFIFDKNVKKVEEGEVIKYKMDGYYVIHRVVNITEDVNGNKIFVTKGDNNNDIDLYPVEEKQFDGVVKARIPFVGYPTIILSRLLHTDVEDKVIVDKGRTN